ncbi:MULTISPECIES: hypothetical protein [Pseudomonas]|uniref:hypothetical protein n=1 Tax=Pseudomonas TaxID=286 RepID=UPI001C0A842B|nr:MULTISPECIES: hypothetical protein [Pseudomonas]MCK3840079.1 hypothetical protein [Pseudomonas sp. NCIMB 10586]VCU67813.1 chemotaxis protein [Pseudomonas synxantha]
MIPTIGRQHLFGALGILWILAVSAALISQHFALNQLASQSDVQALQKRMVQLEIPSVQPPAASPAELAALQKTLEAQMAVVAQSVEERVPLQTMRELERQIQRIESLPPPPAIIEPKPRKAPKLAQRTATLPPFQIIGIEMRGTERFLAVSPRNAQSLEQARLLRTGDSQDSWTLEALEASTAVFRVRSTVRRMAVP